MPAKANRLGNLRCDGTRRFGFVGGVSCLNQPDFAENWAKRAAVLNHFGNAPMQRGSGSGSRSLLYVERFGAGGLAVRIGRDLVDPRFGLAK
jgi:hypothetical protein